MTSGGVERGVLVTRAPHAARARLIEAALGCVARVGVSKTTLDDVAREAGVSRATLYRVFSNKRELFDAVVAQEAVSLCLNLELAAAGTADLEDALVVLVTTASRSLSEHAALRTVMLMEPELLLPNLAFGEADAFLRTASALVAPVLERFLPPERVDRGAEWAVRVFLSYMCSPSEAVRLDVGPSVRRLVRDFVVPALRGTRAPGTARPQAMSAASSATSLRGESR